MAHECHERGGHVEEFPLGATSKMKSFAHVIQTDSADETIAACYLIRYFPVRSHAGFP